MDVINWGDQEILAFTYEEEIEIATKVMDYMAMRRVWGDFQTLLERIYYAKCLSGSWINAEDFLRMLEFVDRYHLEPPDVGIVEGNIKDDLDEDLFPTREERNTETRRTIIMAWREVWSTHTALKAVADVFKTFPGDSERQDCIPATEDELTLYERLEAEFWDEVNSIMKEFDYRCTRREAYIMASDYMPRGDLSDNTDD